MVDRINQLLTIEGFYGKEVNIGYSIEDDADNLKRLNSYVPTTQSVLAIKSIIEGLAPNSQRRSHLITGQYGTGKSHLGLVLVNLFQYEHEANRLATFLKKIQIKNEEIAIKVSRNREIIPKPFLIVIPDISNENFDMSLLSALQSSLERENIDFSPNTYFSEALRAIENILDDNELRKRLDSFLNKNGMNTNLLKKSLARYDVKSYSLFCKAHKEVTTAPFAPQATAKASDVFLEVSKYLRAGKKFEGVLVIADEFGAQLTQLAKDPDGIEGLAVQKFAERCNSSRENQIHFIAIAHRTLADYAIGKRSQADWVKISGRFEEHNLNLSKGQEYEIVDIINSVINLNTENEDQRAMWETLNNHFGTLRDWTKNLEIFPEMGDQWIFERLLRGCYPLHPGTVFCLPWIAQRLGQEKRTAFRFLTTEINGSLPDFLSEGNIFDGNKINLYTPEKLIDYFELTASENTRYKHLLNSRQNAVAKYGKEPTALRIINLLTVLDIVSHPLMQPTRNIIVSLLSKGDNEQINDILDILVEQRAIRYRKETERFELPTYNSGEISAREAINKIKENLLEDIDFTKEFSKYCNTDKIIAREYSQGHGIERYGAVEIISPKHLTNLSPYLQEIETWYFPKMQNYSGDAIILYSFVEKNSQIDEMEKMLEKGTGLMQLIVAVPKTPYPNTDALFDLMAIKYIRDELGYKIDEESVNEEDLESIEEDKSMVVGDDVFNYMKADNWTWYFGKDRRASLREGEEETLLSDILDQIFYKTPYILDEALAVVGRDKHKRFRQKAISQLLGVEGNLRIKEKGGEAHHRILRTALRETGLLEKVNDLGLEQEFVIRNEISVDSPIWDIWNKIGDYIQQSESIDLEELYRELISSPYGLRPQLIEVLLAAYVRKLKNQVLIFDSEDNFESVVINADLIEKISLNPGRYYITYFELLPEQELFLTSLCRDLSIDQLAIDLSLVETAYNLLRNWFGNLPEGAKFTIEHSSEIRNFIDFMQQHEQQENVRDFMLLQLPEQLGFDSTNWQPGTAKSLIKKFNEYKESLDNYISLRGYKAVEKLCELFEAEGHTHDGLLKATNKWFSNLAEAQRLHHFSGPAAALINAIRNTTGTVEERFLVKLANELTPKSYLFWITDGDMNAFLAEVRFGKREVENWSASKDIDINLVKGESKEQILESLRSRIYDLVLTYDIDEIDLKNIFQEILEEITKI